MMPPRINLITLASTTVVAGASTIAAAQSFQGVGIPDGLPRSEARGVSDDGSTVVVQASTDDGPGSAAFVWQAGPGLTPVPALSGANFNTGFAISGDGASVVGGSGTWGTPFTPYRSGTDGLISLGDLPGGRIVGQGFGASFDGSAVVGFSEVVGPDEGGPLSNAFRWTEDDGIVALAPLAGDNQSLGNGVSRDGRTAVGQSGSTATFEFEPAVWSADGTPQGLGLLAGSFGRANAVSDNGVVVGGSSSPNTADGLFFETEAFRWTEADGMTGLGDLAGGDFFSAAEATTADGSIVVGFGFTDVGQEASYWTEPTGMIRMTDVLDQAGLDLAGWTLTNVYGVTPDGLTFVGSGTNPDGLTEGWVATIPEPASLSLLGFAGAALLRRRR